MDIFILHIIRTSFLTTFVTFFLPFGILSFVQYVATISPTALLGLPLTLATIAAPTITYLLIHRNHTTTPIVTFIICSFVGWILCTILAFVFALLVYSQTLIR